ncbi:hypothetical protein K7432_012529 [Basidiobolus ranarum]|uniref:Uncharacterized protein n=1 Tax=Basidiobolus ranarum TaxID=34480 RepID=A0ABR2VS48_9FUNG
MDRECLITEGNSSPTSSYMDGSPSSTISAFEIRFNKHRMNETKVEPLDPDSNQRKVPLPFQKRDKIRSSMEFDRCRKMDLNRTPSKDFRPTKPTKLAPMPSPSSTISSSDTESKHLETSMNNNNFGSVSSKKSSAIPFDEIVIPTVYKRMKMNGEVFGDESGEDRMALADIWYGQNQGSAYTDKTTDGKQSKTQDLESNQTANPHANSKSKPASSNATSDGDLGNSRIADNQSYKDQPSNIKPSGVYSKGCNSYSGELNEREAHLTKQQREIGSIEPQAIHLKNLRETMGSEKHTPNPSQADTRLAYSTGNIVKEAAHHRGEREQPMKTNSGCCVIL